MHPLSGALHLLYAVADLHIGGSEAETVLEAPNFTMNNNGTQPLLKAPMVVVFILKHH